MSRPDNLPLASIIIPAYNAASFVETAINSARQQTYPNLQVIVVNDGSTDETANALGAYRGVVDVLELDENRGSSAARNMGLSAAQGDIVGFHDADDRWSPDRLARCIEHLLTRPELSVVTTDADILADGKVVGSMYEGTRWPQFDEADQFHALLLGNFMFSNVIGWTHAFRECGGFDETLRSSVDYEMWLKLTRRGNRLGLVQQNLAQYVRRPEALSADHARQRASHYAAISRHVDAISRPRCQGAGPSLYQAALSVQDADVASRLFRLAALDKTLSLRPRARCFLRGLLAQAGVRVAPSALAASPVSDIPPSP